MFLSELIPFEGRLRAVGSGVVGPRLKERSKWSFETLWRKIRKRDAGPVVKQEAAGEGQVKREEEFGDCSDVDEDKYDDVSFGVDSDLDAEKYADEQKEEFGGSYDDDDETNEGKYDSDERSHVKREKTPTRQDLEYFF